MIFMGASQSPVLNASARQVSRLICLRAHLVPNEVLPLGRGTAELGMQGCQGAKPDLSGGALWGPLF